MLTVKEYGDVQRRFHVRKQRIKQIAREMGVSRNTVRKYLRNPQKPEYRRLRLPAKPVLGEFTDLIDNILAEDKKAPRKQRHTARRIFERLRAEYGFRGGETTVRAYVAQMRLELGMTGRAVTFPLEHRAQDAAAQMDWGERKAVIGGEETTAHFCAIRLNYSGRLFVQAFPLERQEMLFEGHRRAFAFFGGAPPLITYDNMKVAVKKVLKGRNRKEQENFAAFHAHYLYEADFCNTYAPNEKGGVENIVGYVGRNFFVPVPEFESFAELNAALETWCEANDRRVPQNRTKPIADLFLEEAPHLIALPERPFECCRARNVRASHEALVSFDLNRYSVPVAYAHRKLVLKAFPSEIRICYGDGAIASHPRSFERGAYVLDPLHYVPLLARKPGALLYAKPFQDWKLPPVFSSFHKTLLERDPLGGGKAYASILALLMDHTADKVAAALEEAGRHRCFNRDAVLCLLMQQSPERKKSADTMDLSRLPRLDSIRVPAPNAEKYDALLK